MHAIALKTLSNYANHLMDTPLDAVFTTREWRVVQMGSRALHLLRRTFDR